jgi:hypothetical protein
MGYSGGLANAAARDGWRSRLATPLFHLLSPGGRGGAGSGLVAVLLVLPVPVVQGANL